MIILTNVKQINELVNKLFCFQIKFADDDYSFINEMIPNEILQEQNAKISDDAYEIINDLTGLIFQLNDYMPALSNMTNLLLLTKGYDYLYFFVTKIFYEHIGTVHYISTDKSYNYMQRMFDRFVEIVKNCNILKELYIPFLLHILSADETKKISVWQEPALEFLKKFETENEEWIQDFIFKDEQGFLMLALLCAFSTQKGLLTALKYFKANKHSQQVLALFKDMKKDVVLHIDKELSQSQPEDQKMFAEILYSWGDDSEAKSRLEEIYKLSSDPVLRNEIAHKIGSVQITSFKSEKNFLFAVRRNVKVCQERTLGLPFDRCNLTYKTGLKADFESYTYLINLFKEENNLLNLEKFLSLENVFNMDTLTEFANQLFFTLSKKEDVNCAKWAIRLISLFAKQNIVENFIVRLFDEKRIKEAKYFLSCVIYSRRNVTNCLKRLAQIQNFIPYKEQFIKMYSEFNNYNSQQVRESLLPEEFDEQFLNEERKVLFDNFIAGRQYSQEYFDILFVKNILYNKLAQDIVFGEYKFGRLYSVFILNGRVKTFIYNNHIDDSYIAIIHPIDCDERMEHIYNVYPHSTFKQFEKSYFNVNNFSRSQVSIQSLAGTVVNPRIFVQKLEKYNFVKNSDNPNCFESVINVMPLNNLICELEFEGIVDEKTTYKTLSNIYFYRINDCIKSGEKYITYKQNAVSVGSLPPRYFSYVLSAITKATKEH